jgi:hypothetical protein
VHSHDRHRKRRLPYPSLHFGRVGIGVLPQQQCIYREDGPFRCLRSDGALQIKERRLLGDDVLQDGGCDVGISATSVMTWRCVGPPCERSLRYSICQ